MLAQGLDEEGTIDFLAKLDEWPTSEVWQAIFGHPMP
jgi:hypothetical protein